MPLYWLHYHKGIKLIDANCAKTDSVGIVTKRWALQRFASIFFSENGFGFIKSNIDNFTFMIQSCSDDLHYQYFLLIVSFSTVTIQRFYFHQHPLPMMMLPNIQGQRFVDMSLFGLVW